MSLAGCVIKHTASGSRETARAHKDFLVIYLQHPTSNTQNYFRDWRLFDAYCHIYFVHKYINILKTKTGTPYL